MSLSVCDAATLSGSLLASLQVVGPESSMLAAGSRHAGAEVSDLGTSCGILDAVVRQNTPAVWPDDVLSALRVIAAQEPPVPARAIRSAQARLDGVATSPIRRPSRAAGSVGVAGEQEPSRHEVE